MATAKAKAPPITSVVVRYDLFDLPTAQHKAGLAGLVLQIRSMAERAAKGGPPKGEEVPVIAELTPTSATITFTEKAVQGLFDDLYDAQVVEVAVRSRWPGQVPKREEENEEEDEGGKRKKVRRFIYDVTQPLGHFLRPFLEDGPWMKLWRDMLWAIPRGNPQARLPFEDRAATPKRPCREGKAVWADLVKVEQARTRGAFVTAEVAGSLWLGAQARNAEAIPFEGRTEQNLLLHFWPLTTLVFVPQQVGGEGETEFVGYALAIPEVSDLGSFLADYPSLLGQLSKDVRGFRPAEAVIDLPAQGALSFLDHLALLAQQKAERSDIQYAVGSIEYLHLAKFGNNIKSMVAGRLSPRPNLLEGYEAIVGRPGQPAPYRNPLFRRGLMLALLEDREWYEEMADILAGRPWPFFVRSGESPRTLPWFWQDAARYFEDHFDNHELHVEAWRSMNQTNPEMGVSPPGTPLELLIHRLVQTYVNQRTEARSGIKWDDFKDNKVKDERTGKERVNIPEAYREAREKVASGTFLEMRSRRDQAFVDHFTGTFCSVKQRLREEEFQTVARALIEQPENVKTLTLLALSANS